MKKVLLNKSLAKVKDDLRTLKETRTVSRETDQEIVLIVEDDKAKELTEMYEGLEEINE